MIDPGIVVYADDDVRKNIIQLNYGEENRPDPQWVRGRCPECGDDLVSNMYFKPGDGYILRWICWGRTYDKPNCDYERVL